MHIEQVLGDVPKAERCRCHEQASKSPPQPVEGQRPSWVKQIFGLGSN
jgi:hypothetical protein